MRIGRIHERSRYLIFMSRLQMKKELYYVRKQTVYGQFKELLKTPLLSFHGYAFQTPVYDTNAASIVTHSSSTPSLSVMNELKRTSSRKGMIVHLRASK